MLEAAGTPLHLPRYDRTDRPLSAYVHVPFCRVRCGYCDFNTYSAQFGLGADLASYHQTLIEEIAKSAQMLSEAGYPQRQLQTVFFGGGTPTMLPSKHLVEILTALRNSHGIAPGAEVTVEANPDTVTPQLMEQLAAGGFTRVSMGMQSAVPHVLATLDRTHTPSRVPQAVEAAKAAGLQVSVDLIYGTPGESIGDWQTSLDAALGMEPDHISAYSLIVEPGTKMYRQIERGQLPQPSDDEQAEKYEIADATLAASGYAWYEISNWERSDQPTTPGTYPGPRASQHNLAYWRDWDWWGYGPGAHSHVANTRWWTLKHPTAHASAVREGYRIAGSEQLGEDERTLERVMLGIRTREGIEASQLTGNADELKCLASEGLIDESALELGRVALTLRGRLLADLVTDRLT